MSLLSRQFLSRRPRPQVLIVGGSYAGLAAARALAGKPVQVTLLDRRPAAEWLPNVHELLSRQKSATDLQRPLHALLRAQGHDFLCTEVTAIDRQQQTLSTLDGRRLDYDFLILATGSEAHDHGVPGAAEHALHPRSVDECQRIGNALTRLAALPSGRDVVIAGGGIEGLEMLGEVLRRFGRGQRLNLHLVEAAPQLFAKFPGLHERLLEDFRGQVQVHVGRRIVSVDADQVQLDNGHILPSRLTVWSTGRRSAALPARAGLCTVGADAPVRDSLQSRDDNRVFVVGDAAALPAPLEKQAFYAQDAGRHAAHNLLRLIRGESLQPFQAVHKPVLMSFGDRDGVLFYGRHALASAALIPLKEGIYQFGILSWEASLGGRVLMQKVVGLPERLSTLKAWQQLRKSADSRLFEAR